MFGIRLSNACLMTLVLFVAGCGVFFSDDAGVEGTIDPTVMLMLDDDFELSEGVEVGDVLGLDMAVPVKGGYVMDGASFDPAMLRLEHYLEYDREGEPRAQYMFTALAAGTTDVLVKMRPMSGGDGEIYKRVTVNVDN